MVRLLQINGSLMDERDNQMFVNKYGSIYFLTAILLFLSKRTKPRQRIRVTYLVIQSTQEQLQG